MKYAFPKVVYKSIAKDLSNKKSAVNPPHKYGIKNVGKKVVLDTSKLNVNKKNPNIIKIQNIRNSGKGKMLVIVASGPSVLEVDFKPLYDNSLVDIMLINRPIVSGLKHKYWAFCDKSQYKMNREYFDQYKGTVINSNNVVQVSDKQIIIKSKSMTGFSMNLLDGYCIGYSSVYANIQTALWMGYDKIFVFGMDMCLVDGKLYHSNDNHSSVKNRVKRFDREANCYNDMIEKLSENKRKSIHFCSDYNKYGFIDSFSRISHKSAIDSILSLCKT